MILRVDRVPRVRRSRYAYWLIVLAGISGGYCCSGDTACH